MNIYHLSAYLYPFFVHFSRNVPSFDVNDDKAFLLFLQNRVDKHFFCKSFWLFGVVLECVWRGVSKSTYVTKNCVPCSTEKTGQKKFDDSS